jgi:fatty-acid desaturase
VNAILFTLSPISLQQVLLYVIPMMFMSTIGTLTTGFGLLLAAGIHTYQSGFEPWHLFYVLAAFLITFPVTSIYHSSAHQSFGPKLSRFIGEICGLIHVSNMDEWSITHHYHHRHADDPVRDPHPPMGKTFIEFASTTGKTIGKALLFHYMEVHGKSEENIRLLQRGRYLGMLRQNLLTLFWFLALGPTAFIYLIGANIVFKKVHYAWLNWATHAREGQPAILNETKGLYILVNALSFNLYYHKNHHLRPSLYNPKFPEKTSPSEHEKAS